jgi:hypothetical protein
MSINVIVLHACHHRAIQLLPFFSLTYYHPAMPRHALLYQVHMQAALAVFGVLASLSRPLPPRLHTRLSLLRRRPKRASGAAASPPCSTHEICWEGSSNKPSRRARAGFFLVRRRARAHDGGHQHDTPTAWGGTTRRQAAETNPPPPRARLLIKHTHTHKSTTGESHDAHHVEVMDVSLRDDPSLLTNHTKTNTTPPRPHKTHIGVAQTNHVRHPRRRCLGRGQRVYPHVSWPP